MLHSAIEWAHKKGKEKYFLASRSKTLRRAFMIGGIPREVKQFHDKVKGVKKIQKWVRRPRLKRIESVLEKVNTEQQIEKNCFKKWIFRYY